MVCEDNVTNNALSRAVGEKGNPFVEAVGGLSGLLHMPLNSFLAHAAAMSPLRCAATAVGSPSQLAQ